MNRSPRASIVYGSRYGATKGTSEEIARVLRGRKDLLTVGERGTALNHRVAVRSCAIKQNICRLTMSEALD